MKLIPLKGFQKKSQNSVKIKNYIFEMGGKNNFKETIILTSSITSTVVDMRLRMFIHIDRTAAGATTSTPSRFRGSF